MYFKESKLVSYLQIATEISSKPHNSIYSHSIRGTTNPTIIYEDKEVAIDNACPLFIHSDHTAVIMPRSIAIRATAYRSVGYDHVVVNRVKFGRHSAPRLDSGGKQTRRHNKRPLPRSAGLFELLLLPYSISLFQGLWDPDQLLSQE